jgi:uncharacterized protein
MSWIETFSGKQIDLLHPDPEQFTLDDIFHALRYMPRFGGHTNRFYSVGNHSYNVALLVPDHLKFQAIMHDATEAFIGDMPTPFKRLMPDYKAAEDRLWMAICTKFSLPYKLDPLVKQADAIALIHERDILKPTGIKWPDHENVIRLPVGSFCMKPIAKDHLVAVAKEYQALK